MGIPEVPDSYYESAFGQQFTWLRAIEELSLHGVPGSEHATFVVECWSVHATSNDENGTIPAIRVLEWLGY